MTRLVGYGAACALALSATLSAQNPPKPTSPPPASPTYPQPAPSPASQAAGEMVTVEGCLYREVEVPGRPIPEAQWSRVNADDDYVLADTRFIKGTAPTGAQSQEASPTGTSGTAARPLMLKIDDEDDAPLKLADNAGKRVQIDGKLEHTERAGRDVSAAMDLVELDATALRAVGGECPKPERK